MVIPFPDIPCHQPALEETAENTLEAKDNPFLVYLLYQMLTKCQLGILSVTEVGSP